MLPTLSPVAKFTTPSTSPSSSNFSCTTVVVSPILLIFSLKSFMVRDSKSNPSPSVCEDYKRRLEVIESLFMMKIPLFLGQTLIGLSVSLFHHHNIELEIVLSLRLVFHLLLCHPDIRTTPLSRLLRLQQSSGFQSNTKNVKTLRADKLLK